MEPKDTIEELDFSTESTYITSSRKKLNVKWTLGEPTIPHYLYEYPKWYKNLWAFIHVNDVAQAVERSLSADLPHNHEAFFITADNNWTGQESRILAKQFYPETLDCKPNFSGKASFISSQKAKAMLNFAPRCSVSDVFS